MANRNTLQAWGLPARFLHWLVAVMILVQVPLGFWMNDIYKELEATGSADWSLLLRASMLHHTNGFMILILVAARLGGRAANPTPELPQAMRTWQKITAHSTHIFLYGLLILFPLTGWAALSAYEGEFPIYFFGWDSVPRIVPQAGEGNHAPYEFYAAIHRAAWRVGAVVLGMHIGGALWHHFVLKDGVLRRMLRGRP